MSSYEEKVITLLRKAKISFVREKRFADLRGGRYRFDFEAIVDGAPVLLEVQGEQHYRRVSRFQPGYSDFTAAQERDRRKISYALANQIPLYIIPYWELDNIHTAAALFSQKYRATNRWKNDLDWEKHKNLTKR